LQNQFDVSRKPVSGNCWRRLFCGRLGQYGRSNTAVDALLTCPTFGHIRTPYAREAPQIG